MSEFSFIVLKLAVSLAIILITTYLLPYLKSKVSNERWTEILTVVETAVYAAEQTLEGGPVKKEEVTKFVSQWLSDHGIDITAEQLDRLIESAVFEMNGKVKHTKNTDKDVDDGR